MIKLSDLPDIQFVNADKSAIEVELNRLYEDCTGRTLAKGDPVRLFLLCITNIVILLLNSINETGRQNLLRYAKGGNLDHIGVLVGTERMQATAAMTTVRITLSEVRWVNTVVPAGTRFTAKGNDALSFAVLEPVIIKAGAVFTEVSAQCTQPGTAGNGFDVGELDTIVDPVPYVASMVNTTVSAGGTDAEADDSYRKAIHEAPEGFSVAGPNGAYRYYAKRSSSLISDVAVTSPKPGQVLVTPLLYGGEIPEEELLTIVETALQDKNVRPLTDKVMVKAPAAVSYNVNLEYYIAKENSGMASSIQASVQQTVDEYVAWQKERLGRDINPSELIMRVMQAGAKRVAVTEPVYKKLAATEVAREGTVTVELGGIEDE